MSTGNLIKKKSKFKNDLSLYIKLQNCLIDLIN